MSEFERPDHEWIHEKLQRANDEEVFSEIAHEIEQNSKNELDQDASIYNELGGRAFTASKTTHALNELNPSLALQEQTAIPDKTTPQPNLIEQKRQDNVIQSSVNQISQQRNTDPDFINFFQSVGQNKTQQTDTSTAQTRTASFLKPAVRRWPQETENTNAQAFKPLQKFSEQATETQTDLSQSNNILPKDRIVYPTERGGGLRSTVTRRSHEKWRQNKIDETNSVDTPAKPAHTDMARSLKGFLPLNGRGHLNTTQTKAAPSKYQFNAQNGNEAHDNIDESAQDAAMDFLKPISAATAVQRGILRNLNESGKNRNGSPFSVETIDQKLLFGGIEPFTVEKVIKKTIHTKSSTLDKTHQRIGRTKDNNRPKTGTLLVKHENQDINKQEINKQDINKNEQNTIGEAVSTVFEQTQNTENMQTSVIKTQTQAKTQTTIGEKKTSIIGINRSQNNSQSAFQRLEKFRQSKLDDESTTHQEKDPTSENILKSKVSFKIEKSLDNSISFEKNNHKLDVITLFPTPKNEVLRSELTQEQKTLETQRPVVLVSNENNVDHHDSVIEEQYKIKKTSEIKVVSLNKSLSVAINAVSEKNRHVIELINKKSKLIKSVSMPRNAVSAACIGFFSFVILLNVLTGTTAAGSITPTQSFDAWVTDVFKPARVFLGAPG